MRRSKILAVGTQTTHSGRFGGTLNVIANSFAAIQPMRQTSRKTIADGGLIHIPDDDRTIAGRCHMRRKLAASTPREYNRTPSSRSRNGMAFPSHRSDRQAKHRRFH
jgi:hypothetical protein